MAAVAAEQCPQFTLARDRRYSHFVSKPVYEHVTSSFTLDQDARCVPDAGAVTQSASDYRRCAAAAAESCRPRSPARPRPPASIFHEDERNLDDVTSEQLRHYRPHPTQSRAAEDYYEKYRATTYKRHADPRFKTFETMSAGFYYEKPINREQLDYEDQTRSHIFNGDPEKTPCPISESRERFGDHNVAKPALERGDWTPCPIIGDNRLPRFSSTHVDVYRPHAEDARTQPSHRIGESVILKDELGERGAVERSTTIYRDCFRPRQMDPVPVELRSSAVASRMRETTFRLDDGRPAVYTRASSDAFRPNFDHRNEIVHVQYNPSHVFNVDDHPQRLDNDVPDSTHRADFINWMRRGAGPATPAFDLRANNFDFGDRQLVTKFYEQSSSSYAPWERDEQTTKRLDSTTSHLPFVETDSQHAGTVYAGDYVNHGMCKLKLNEDLIESYKKTHIRNDDREHCMTTENMVHYTPKATVKPPPGDPWRNIRSSVPFSCLPY